MHDSKIIYCVVYKDSPYRAVNKHIVGSRRKTVNYV